MSVAAPEVAGAVRGRVAGGRSVRGRTGRPPVRQRAGSVTDARRSRQSGFERAKRAAPTTRVHRSNYQPVILAEFVAAVLLVAVTPIATGKNKSGLSPYAGQDMIKLGSLTVLYLILALLSVGGRGPGRMGAWFGGLILLTVGLAEAANLAKVLDLGGIGGSPTDAEAAGTTQTGDTLAGRN